MQTPLLEPHGAGVGGGTKCLPHVWLVGEGGGWGPLGLQTVVSECFREAPTPGQRAAGGVRVVRWCLSLSPESGGQLCQELCIVVVVVVVE